MFYSPTFLARKGPLGTVWCAAHHLQHRLKKSHYTSTDIPSTVGMLKKTKTFSLLCYPNSDLAIEFDNDEHIMYPDIPIARRMSGHLLLGVVRIYSKKVNYLFHDCHIILVGLSKAFDAKKVDLPDNENQAPVHAITLPETFNLDALELDDDDIYTEGSPDNHLRNEEDIRLPDQIPTGANPYIAITFDEDMMDLLHSEAAPESGIQLMDEDVILQSPIGGNLQNKELNAAVAFQDPGPANETKLPGTSMAFGGTGPSSQTEVLRPTMDFYNSHPGNETEAPNIIHDDIVTQDFPEIEVRRDTVPDISNECLPLGHPEQRNDASEMRVSLERIWDDKEIHTPILRSMSTSGAESIPFHDHSGPPMFAAFRESLGNLSGHKSPQLAIQPSPPVQQPRKRQRTRGRFFDNELVLSDRSMKKALEDSSDLVQKRMNVRASALAVWKSNSILRKGQLFHGASVTGLCVDISEMFERDYTFAKPNLPVLQGAVSSPRILQSPAPSTEAEDLQIPATATAAEASPEHRAGRPEAAVPEIDRETEYLRDDQGSAYNNLLYEFEPSPLRPICSARDDSSPLSINSLRSETTPRVLPTPDAAAFTGNHGSAFETPRAFLDKGLVLGSMGLSDIPEMLCSAEDLYFLEDDNNSPTEFQASHGVDSLSVRTRAAAQYLKKQSPITAISENSSGDLSLNKILEGKTRKLCARMFYETLVLKSYGVIDVQQEKAYEDITLKLTATLSKAQI
ncbi:hypothetical protein SLEP1_g20147 [Rubroshorea leprosula]|uniref:Sister chromatid cohesion 1 protein 3 n=1 Tax=Rubroshorea leprosula TaxID=152421 RepID=A0AAV5J517_9ROSI|nr:hypothetical protein SLEP1_g20147 [Rubroshorea leprosula]